MDEYSGKLAVPIIDVGIHGVAGLVCVYRIVVAYPLPVWVCRGPEHAIRVTAKAGLTVTLTDRIHAQTAAELGRFCQVSVNSSWFRVKSPCANVIAIHGLLSRESPHNWEALVMLSLRVNGKMYIVDVEPDTPLLWVIRDTIGLTGTKYGCGMALCGSCTVHLNGKAVRSCMEPVSQAAGKDVTTIEGLSPNAQHPLQVAWREGDVPECGYCQPGHIMAAAALLSKNSNPTDADILSEITNLCRCGTYTHIRQAIHRAAQLAVKS